MECQEGKERQVLVYDNGRNHRMVEAKDRGSSLKEDPYGRPYIDAGENTEAFVERVRRDLEEWKGIREKQKAKEGT